MYIFTCIMYVMYVLCVLGYYYAVQLCMYYQVRVVHVPHTCIPYLCLGHVWIKRGKTNSEISQKREPQKRCRRKECRYDIFHSTGVYYVWCIAVMVYTYKSTALFMFYQDCNAIRTIFYKVNLVGFFFRIFFFSGLQNLFLQINHSQNGKKIPLIWTMKNLVQFTTNTVPYIHV